MLFKARHGQTSRDEPRPLTMENGVCAAYLDEVSAAALRPDVVLPLRRLQGEQLARDAQVALQQRLVHLNLVRLQQGLLQHTAHYPLNRVSCNTQHTQHSTGSPATHSTLYTQQGLLQHTAHTTLNRVSCNTQHTQHSTGSPATHSVSCNTQHTQHSTGSPATHSTLYTQQCLLQHTAQLVTQIRQKCKSQVKTHFYSAILKIITDNINTIAWLICVLYTMYYYKF